MPEDAPEHASQTTAEFADINLSLCRLLNVGKGGEFDAETKKSIWSALIPTLTSQSSILMRFKPLGSAPTECPLLRLLTGKELMSVAGWTADMWGRDQPGEILDDAVLTDLAGNAFPAFAIGPIMLIALSNAGWHHEPFPGRCADECSSDEVEGDSDSLEDF